RGIASVAFGDQPIDAGDRGWTFLKGVVGRDCRAYLTLRHENEMVGVRALASVFRSLDARVGDQDAPLAVYYRSRLDSHTTERTALRPGGSAEAHRNCDG